MAKSVSFLESAATADLGPLLVLRRMTAADWFIRDLQKRGVEWMATLCGHGLDPLFEAARRAGFRLIDTRNEQTASYIADSYGRLTRRPGVCCVSSGVALVNALTGLTNAYFDGAPMLLISGAAPQLTAGMGHFQDLDQVALAAPVTRYSRLIHRPERTLQLLDEALVAAAHPGPVHLMFPMDVQTAEVAAEDMFLPNSAPRPGVSGDAEETGALLARAKQPLIVAGSGVFYAGACEALIGFAERFSIPLVTPIWDRGCVDRISETFLGVIGAASGGPNLLPEADCVLLAGAARDYRVGYLQQNASVTSFLGDWDELAKAYQSQGGRGHGAWLTEARSRRDAFRKAIDESAARQSESGPHAVHVIDALRAEMPDDAVLLIDGGSIGQWAHQLLTDRYPGHWLTCGRSGVVGWGIGGAMAARLAYPERPVILLSGDGAFTFTVAELECAVRQQLPFVAVVADDQAWGITRSGHLRQFGAEISSSLGPIAFDRLAESLGACGVRATSPKEMRTSIKEALREPTVTVIHVPISSSALLLG